MSENCFTRCVNTFQYRDLAEDEMSCVDTCTNKHVRVNHKIMALYMEVQPIVMQRRIDEMDKLNAAAAEQAISETPAVSELPTAPETPTSPETPTAPEIPAEQSPSDVSTGTSNSTEIPVAS